MSLPHNFIFVAHVISQNREQNEWKSQTTRKSIVQQFLLRNSCIKQNQNNGNVDGLMKSKGETSQDRTPRQRSIENNLLMGRN